MKKLIIHIGPHKTGTTTIQEALFINQEKLLRNSILVPKIGQPFPRNAAHNNLAWELIEEEMFSPVGGTWDDLGKIMEETPAKTIILSSEEFSRIPKTGMDRIKEYSASYEISIVIYLRSQEQIMQSFWAEMLKSSDHDEFHDNFGAWLEKQGYYYINADYFVLLNKWRIQFGKENLCVRVLEQGQLNGNLFHDFLSACKVENPDQYESPENKNISPGIKTLTLIQEFKKRLAGKLDDSVKTKLYSILRRFGEEQGWDKQRVNLISAEISENIMDRFREGNQKVARDYFGREQLFFKSFKEKEITQFSAGDFHPSELLDAFAFVFKKMIQTDRLESHKTELLETEFANVKERLDSIYSSRGWKIVEKIRTILRKIRKLLHA